MRHLAPLPIVALLLSGAAAAMPRREAIRGAARPPRSPVLAPPEPPARHVAVGFSRSPTLREAVRGRLIGLGRYRLDAAPQLPGSEGGLLVGGRVTVLREADGFYECRARYFVAASPSGAVLFVDGVAASVPLGAGAGDHRAGQCAGPAPQSDCDEARSWSDRAAALSDGRQACIEELAAQIAARLPRLP